MEGLCEDREASLCCCDISEWVTERIPYSLMINGDSTFPSFASFGSDFLNTKRESTEKRQWRGKDGKAW